MGAYVYKVTKEKVKLSNGETANVAVFAYKPWNSFWNAKEAEKKNNVAHFRTGCTANDRAADDGHRSVWVVSGTCVMKFPRPLGSFVDDYVEKYIVRDVSPAQ